jgi:hypothetical protein
MVESASLDQLVCFIWLYSNGHCLPRVASSETSHRRRRRAGHGPSGTSMPLQPRSEVAVPSSAHSIKTR